MSPLSRRGFLGTALAGAAAGWASPRKARALGRAAGPQPPALIQVTDLYRPHIDPDDHFDLATVFALAARGRLDLLAVMIDHPPEGSGRDPDVQAVAQLNWLGGLAVPAITGSPKRLDPAAASLPENRRVVAGARALLGILRAADRPVAISIVGSSRDVALAGRLEPDLFAAKCAGIYLNAGSGTPDPAKARRLEYNVGLDPLSYAAIFDLPCPVYWLPCFEEAPGGGVSMAVAEFGTYYRFRQKDLLARLSPPLRNYFAFMFKQGESDLAHQSEAEGLRPAWLRYLQGPPEQALLERQAGQFRNMWSTAGFFQAAGLAVTREGRVVESTGATAAPVYTFDPVRVRCGQDGVTSWSPDPGSRNRFLFHVRDRERYAGAMTAALGEVLGDLQ